MSTRRTKLERCFITKDPEMGMQIIKAYISRKKNSCDAAKRFYNKMIKNGQSNEIVGEPYKVYAYKGGYGLTIPEDGEYYIIPFVDYVESYHSIIYYPCFTMKLL